MNKNDILALYHYNQWANAKILNATARVTHEQFIAPASFPFGGLRGTLVHCMVAMHLWRLRWEGTSLTELFKETEFPTFELLRTRWQIEEVKLMSFIEAVSDEQLNKPLEFKNTKNQPMRDDPLWMVMIHVVNHGTQHRAEAAAILTGLNQSPGDIDLIVYMREKKTAQ